MQFLLQTVEDDVDPDLILTFRLKSDCTWHTNMLLLGKNHYVKFLIENVSFINDPVCEIYSYPLKVPKLCHQTLCMSWCRRVVSISF